MHKSNFWQGYRIVMYLCIDYTRFYILRIKPGIQAPMFQLKYAKAENTENYFALKLLWNFVICHCLYIKSSMQPGETL